MIALLHWRCAMACKYCNGTGRLALLVSSVDCTECAQAAKRDLPVLEWADVWDAWTDQFASRLEERGIAFRRNSVDCFTFESPVFGPEHGSYAFVRSDGTLFDPWDRLIGHVQTVLDTDPRDEHSLGSLQAYADDFAIRLCEHNIAFQRDARDRFMFAEKIFGPDHGFNFYVQPNGDLIDDNAEPVGHAHTIRFHV